LKRGLSLCFFLSITIWVTSGNRLAKPLTSRLWCFRISRGPKGFTLKLFSIRSNAVHMSGLNQPLSAVDEANLESCLRIINTRFQCNRPVAMDQKPEMQPVESLSLSESEMRPEFRHPGRSNSFPFLHRAFTGPRILGHKRYVVLLSKEVESAAHRPQSCDRLIFGSFGSSFFGNHRSSGAVRLATP